MRYNCDCYRVRGTDNKITFEERFQQDLELVPMPNGRAWLMLPDTVLFAANEERRKSGLMEIRPLDKFDVRLRGILELSQAETLKILAAEPGHTVRVVRRGWGRTWENFIWKMED